MSHSLERIWFRGIGIATTWSRNRLYVVSESQVLIKSLTWNNKRATFIGLTMYNIYLTDLVGKERPHIASAPRDTGRNC